MNKLALQIINITPSVAQNQSYAVVLGEIRGNRRLPIVIGMAEAQAIAMALENMIPPRPLTHDLIKNILTTFDIHVREVLINNLVEGVFYSQLICDKDGEEYIIDSRTSDALAIAVRYGCPIYIYSHIMDSAGVELMESEEDESDEIASAGKYEMEEEPSDYSIYTSAELDAILKEALESEDYEKAARIRDEMKKRGKN
jgi:bifunctional DNase/RNase